MKDTKKMKLLGSENIDMAVIYNKYKCTKMESIMVKNGKTILSEMIINKRK